MFDGGGNHEQPFLDLYNLRPSGSPCRGVWTGTIVWTDDHAHIDLHPDAYTYGDINNNACANFNAHIHVDAHFHDRICLYRGRLQF